MARINGDNGNNTLRGTQYGDVIIGLGGDDHLFGYAGDDQLYGGDGADVLHGMDGNDVLYGKGGQDQLYGGNGRDILQGGGSGDRLTGGPGADRFVWDAIPGNDVARLVDNIMDFSFAEGDRVDLSGIDANRLVDGNQAFRFVSGNAFTGRAGEVLTFYANPDGPLVLRFIELDVDGDRQSDFTIGMPGTGDIPAGAFIL